MPQGTGGSFSNVYEDRERAETYATLQFPGTYYLAYRDLPEIIGQGSAGGAALDFGCGAGRSTQFLKELGFDPVGVDVSAEMVHRARAAHPEGDYRVIGEDLDEFAAGSFRVVLAAFTFDNVPGLDRKTRLFRQLGALLAPQGRIVSVVSTPEIYRNEWASFSTLEFPENHLAQSGDQVRIVMKDVADSRPIEDIVCSDADYRTVYAEAGLTLEGVHRPLGRRHEPFDWIAETEVAPWAIYTLTADLEQSNGPVSGR